MNFVQNVYFITIHAEIMPLVKKRKKGVVKYSKVYYNIIG